MPVTFSSLQTFPLSNEKFVILKLINNSSSLTIGHCDRDGVSISDRN